MKALCWHGSGDIRCDTVPDPKIEDPRDCIIKVTTCAICGSDLHLMGGFVPQMKSGDVLGHETMGEVVEVGSAAKGKLKLGDRVVVPFTISCGECRMCKMGHWSCCERSNPAGKEQAKEMGYPTAGLFGYSHAYGGFSGGQAQYMRVPYADVGPIKVPEGLSDEQVLFLSDIFPTGYHAAVNCDIKPGQTIAVFGCGPVGLFAIKSCFMLGAARVIAVDTVPERLALAKKCGAETIDFKAVDDVTEQIKQMTGGNGPDATIEAVGLESHGHGGVTEAIKTHATHMERPYALEMAIKSVRPAGTVSLPGVFIGNVNVPMGMYVGKALTMKTGQTPVQTYLRPLMDKIQSGQIDPSFLITHRIKIEDGPEAYKTFRDKKDGCVKVVIKPNG